MSGDVSRLLALAVVAGVIVFSLKRRSPERGDASPRDRFGLGSILSGAKKARRGPDYVQLAVQKIIDTAEPAGSQWLVLNTCVLIAAKSEQHRKGLNSKKRAISAQIAVGVRKFMTEERARNHIQPMKLDDDAFTVHAITHPEGIVKVVAVQGPSPERDEEWKALLEECATNSACPTPVGGSERPGHTVTHDDSELSTIPVTSFTPHDQIPPTNTTTATAVSTVLDVYLRGRKLASIPVDAGRRNIIVGRSLDGPVRIPAHETSVSGRHLKFDAAADGALTVTDISSSGTHLLNTHGERVRVHPGTPTLIPPGTHLLLGAEGLVEVRTRR